MIIAFSGPMGAGKTSALETLVFNSLDTEHKIRLVKLAQPLYDIQEFAYRRILGAYERPQNFVKDRKLLQFLGSEWGRESLSDSIWLDLWKNEASKFINENYIVACDDVRFDNEAEMIRKNGGIVVKIKASFGKDRISTSDGLVNHKSERGIKNSNADYIIENDGTLSEYQDKLIELFDKIFRSISTKKTGQ